MLSLMLTSTASLLVVLALYKLLPEPRQYPASSGVRNKVSGNLMWFLKRSAKRAFSEILLIATRLYSLRGCDMPTRLKPAL